MSNTPEVIAPDTDDLGQFELLFSGKAEEKPVEAEPEDTGDSTPAPVPEESPEPATSPEEDKIDAPEDGEDDSKLKLKPKKTVQERINELTKQAREAERREAEVLKKLEAVLTKVPEPVKEEPKVETPKAPTPEDVDASGEPLYPLGAFDPAFQEARITYALERERENYRAEERRKIEEDQQRNAETVKAQQLQALQQSWQERIEEAEERLPDIRNKGSALESAFEGLDDNYGEYIAATLMSLDHGPDILYYLAENPDEATAIIRSGAVQATLALGKLEAQLSGGVKKEVKVSNAPLPPPTLARGSGTKLTVAPDTDDLSAFEKEFFKKR